MREYFLGRCVSCGTVQAFTRHDNVVVGADNLLKSRSDVNDPPRCHAVQYHPASPSQLRPCGCALQYLGPGAGYSDPRNATGTP